eukprot:TRINITY_DN2988_c0_g2_i1.p1 TRINITY_DN2988_c0_g2~~TRINITY_DN2988_c0_g2_i1.p1  ORF type:complete len:244 (-),score=65.17 TRINITY_DN2988_c0_g2_i1:85-765(-)
MMEWLFGKKQTPRQVLREHQRTITRAMRELERERRRLEQSEKKVISEIRRVAKQGQMGAARIMAKDLVRTRKHIEKMYKMHTQLQTVNMRLQTINSQAAMAEAMRGVTRAMMRMNRQINLPAMQQIMMEFERQSEIMDMKEETIGETMDDMLEDDDEEEETETIINQVLDELDINMGQELVDTPASGSVVKTSQKKERVAVGASESEVQADRDLQERLENLRKDDV